MTVFKILLVLAVVVDGIFVFLPLLPSALCYFFPDRFLDLFIIVIRPVSLLVLVVVVIDNPMKICLEKK